MADDLAKNKWKQRDLGINLYKGQPTETSLNIDIEDICDFIYPFIQLVNSNAVFSEEQSLKFIPTDCGWTIHDYGEALSVAAPHETKEKKVTSNKIAEQETVAKALVKIIMEKGWTTVDIIAGTKTMKFLIWIEAKKAKFDLTGYNPSAKEQKSYNTLKARNVLVEYPVKTNKNETTTVK